MLRSSLELSGREVTITSVLSGEEALLELNQGPVDLLVTDLRLPGLTGLELLERTRRMYPESQGILITGQPDEAIRQEAEALGVVAFLRKPVSVDSFLDAVDAALFRRHRPDVPITIPESIKPRLVVRLETIRYEVDADAVFLMDRYGKITVKSGGGKDANPFAALPAMMKAFSAGLQASSLMGAFLPQNMQIFEGEDSALILTNVGAYYCLLLHLEAEYKSLDLAALNEIARSAAVDILDFLSSVGDMPGEVLLEEASGEQVEREPMTDDNKAELEERELDIDAVIESDGEGDPAQFWDEAINANPVGGGDDTNTLTYDEARKKGLLADEE